MREEFLQDQLNQAEKDSQKGKKYTGHYSSEDYQSETLEREGGCEREQHFLQKRRLNKYASRNERECGNKNPSQSAAIILLNKQRSPEGGNRKYQYMKEYCKSKRQCSDLAYRNRYITER